MKKIWLITLVSIVLGVVSCSSCSDKDDDKKTTCTVIFDADGGSPTPAAQNVETGSKATAPSTNPTKTGYVFAFWHLGGATTAYNFQTPVNDNITLYAKWVDEGSAEYWQVTWSLNGGTWPTGDNHATQVVKGGALAEPSAPVKSGHTFDGWYKEAGLTNKVAFPYDVSSVTANITFYAKWTSGGSNPSAVNHNISNATEWNSAIAAVNAAGNDKTHTFTITQSFELTGTNTTIFTKDLSGLNVTIKGQSSPAPEISLASSSAGNLIYFYPSQPQKIILENVVLKGHATNNQPVVSVNVKGELVMEGGARITGNTNTEGYGGAVYLGSTLVMNGGEITGNIAGTSSKTNGRGGGVYMADFAELIIEDGRISGNLAHGQGGAVYVGFVATLKMKGGEISGNTARALSAGARGGGVYNSYGKLYMSGGIITGYGQTHGNDIDITEHYTNDPGQRDACNVVVIGVTAMGIYGAALYNNNGENHYGTFDGETFNEAGSLGSKRERDTKVVDGVLE